MTAAHDPQGVSVPPSSAARPAPGGATPLEDDFARRVHEIVCVVYGFGPWTETSENHRAACRRRASVLKPPGQVLREAVERSLARFRDESDDDAHIRANDVYGWLKDALPAAQGERGGAK